MGIYIIKDLNHRTILTVNFPTVSPQIQRAQIQSGNGTQLGYVESSVWGRAEYFNPRGTSIGKFQPQASIIPSYSPVHFQGNQQGIMRIVNATEVHWVRDVSQLGSVDHMPLVATITSGWIAEESRLIEENAPSGQPFRYVIQGADEGRKCIAGMAVFAFELLV